MAGVSSLVRYECGPEGMASKSGRLHQHQHNPYAERYWLGLLNKLRVVFPQSGAPAFLAGEFAIALNTIRNMLPTAWTRHCGGFSRS